MKVLLGVLIGIGIVRMIRFARWRRMHGGPFHRGGGWGGCGGHRFRQGRGPMWALRELDLDPRQQDELKDLWLGLRRTMGEVQFGRWRTMSELVNVATEEPLDAAKLDELAARHGEAHAKAARDVAQAVKRAHESLRPEQRAKLRELAERSGLWRFPRGPVTPPGDGPYRV